MEALFTEAFMPLWALVLALALFFPVRQLIWVIYVRRAARKAEVDAAERARLKRRAGVTSALLSLVFAFLYTSYIFQDVP
jgi:type VI protein secretion system component VasK